MSTVKIERAVNILTVAATAALSGRPSMLYTGDQALARLWQLVAGSVVVDDITEVFSAQPGSILVVDNRGFSQLGLATEALVDVDIIELRD